MKPFIRFVDLLLYTSVFTACCATALTMATEQLITRAIPHLLSPLHLLTFGSTLIVYNTPRLVRKPNDLPGSATIMNEKTARQKYKTWYMLLLALGAVLTLSVLYRLTFGMLVACAILSMFAFAYFLPLLPFKNKKRLRDIGLIKILVLASVWTTATSILPVMYWGKRVLDYPFEILVRFIFIFTLCVVFDIRDMRADMRNNIHTLPNKVGLRNSYLLINVSLLLFAALSVLQYLRYPVNGRLAGALLTVAATWTVVRFIKRQPSDRAYLLLADGVMVLYALLVILI